MQYLLMICTAEADELALEPAAMAEMMGEYATYTQAMIDAGILRGGERLRPTSSATTVRVREGGRMTTDGPFAETKEQMGGFYQIEVDSLDDALGWAERCPSARHGSIEVRPIWPYDGPER